MRAPTPLFWRVITVNVVVFVCAALALALTPATVSSPLTLEQAAVLGLGVFAAILANVLLVRRAFGPLTRLGAVIDRVDLLERGERIDSGDHPPEVSRLVAALNEMLDRLERAQYASDRRAFDAQEAERRRIARELHDELGQNLTALLVHVARAQKSVPDAIRPDLEAAHLAARTNLDEVQRIVQQLRPQALEDLGLPSALKSLAEGAAARTGVTIRLDAPAARIELAADVELTLYRIAQEALTNVARHAEASTVDMVLKVDDVSALLLIQDDGIGATERAHDRSGLHGMRERARLVGGDLSIEPRAEGGVTVRVEIPAAARANGNLA